MLDVEKWWALNLARFTGRDQWQALSREAALQQLDSILQLPVHLQASSNALPARAVLSIQNVIKDLDFARQQPLLQRMLSQIRGLRLRSPPDLLPSIDAHYLVIEGYLNVRSRMGPDAFRRGRPAPKLMLLVSDTVRSLDHLLGERAAALAPEIRAAPPDP
jgi:hypothetical protein